MASLPFGQDREAPPAPVVTASPDHAPENFAGRLTAPAEEDISVPYDDDAPLRIYLLSAFRVAVHGRHVEGRLGEKARALLKVLAANRRQALSRDMLVETIWPSVEPAKGYTSLKVAAHQVRAVIEPDRHGRPVERWLLSRDGTYCLNDAAGIWIDVEALERYWNLGRVLEAGGRLAEAVAVYRQAAALYIGDFLQEDLYADWTIVRREGLRDIYLALLGRLARISYAQGAFEDAIHYAHKIVLMDPCHEEGYQTLLRSHARLDQFGRASAWYTVCRLMLKRELGMEPSEKTVRLFQSLVKRQPELPAE